VIVVGVDGSSGAAAALRFAAEEAELRGTTLRAVHAWTLPHVLAAGGLAPPPTPGLIEELDAQARRVLDEALEAIDDDGHPVERLVVQGSPALVLVAAAAGADLLVVGSRGHGGFAGLLLGSTSQQCALHARCPVVIVRVLA
jgi:nucleotide-binding universal stress UspA family protein